MSTQNQTQAAPEFVEAVRVVAKRDGFRRAGRAWSASGTVVKRSELTEKQIDALCAEPNLVVQFTEIPAEPRAEDKPKAEDEAAKKPEAKESGKAKEKK
ncbi:HI1506-related protein [Desulfocurvibacter africanus]|uniref:HI1506-related protein n=1 Tax=Desulfocurvibacter africanus TaxID=873 RepID=UPI0003F8013E|nr:HI1506-related protein [Desulfocurvibacter africanus]